MISDSIISINIEKSNSDKSSEEEGVDMIGTVDSNENLEEVMNQMSGFVELMEAQLTKYSEIFDNLSRTVEYLKKNNANTTSKLSANIVVTESPSSAPALSSVCLCNSIKDSLKHIIANSQEYSKSDLLGFMSNFLHDQPSVLQPTQSSLTDNYLLIPTPNNWSARVQKASTEIRGRSENFSNSNSVEENKLSNSSKKDSQRKAEVDLNNIQNDSILPIQLDETTSVKSSILSRKKEFDLKGFEDLVKFGTDSKMKQENQSKDGEIHSENETGFKIQQNTYGTDTLGSPIHNRMKNSIRTSTFRPPPVLIPTTSKEERQPNIADSNEKRLSNFYQVSLKKVLSNEGMYEEVPDTSIMNPLMSSVKKTILKKPSFYKQFEDDDISSVKDLHKSPTNIEVKKQTRFSGILGKQI